MAHDVFISYSHKDKAVADAICARLEQDGARCWYAPRDITPGADWAGSIIEAIGSTKIMVLVFTDFSNASKQVMREVNNAVSNGVTIVPFKLTESLPTQSMQYYLSTVHWLDAMNRPLENGIEELNSLVQALLNGTAPQPTSQEFAQAAPTGATGMPKWAVPAIVAVVIVIVAIVAVMAINPFGGGSSGSGGASSASGASASSDAGEATVASVGLPKIDVPPNGDTRIKDPENTGTQGNLQGNYQNGGYAASDGEWIYYRSNDGFSLYKMRVDGTEQTKLNDQASSYIGVLDDYVYFYTSPEGQNTIDGAGIWRMGTDGSRATCIYSGAIEDMFIYKDRIYFKNSLDELKLYSMTLTGADVRKENDLTELYNLAIWDDKIYWCVYNVGMHRANLDGSDVTVITDSEADYMTPADGWIMYNDFGDNWVHLMNAETQETFQIMNDAIDNPVISAYGLVGKSATSDLALVHSDLGSAGSTVLLREKTDGISVAEGYIFYYDKTAKEMRVMDIYGENNLLL